MMLTTTVDQVPHLFRERHILRGYRFIHWPWSYYLSSLWHFHNESLNVWTHLVGGLLLLWQMCSMHWELSPHPHYSESLQVALMFGCSSVILQWVSSVAHLLHNRDEEVHCLVFFCDNAAASVAAFGVNSVTFCFASLPHYFEAVQAHFLWVQVVGALSLSYFYSYALAKYRRQYSAMTSLMMFGPTGLYLLFGTIPLWHRLLLHSVWDAQLWQHVAYVSIFFVGVLFYVSYWPECCWPGQFDIWGHSHQWFHVFGSLSHWAALLAVRSDLLNDHYLLFAKRSCVFTVEELLLALGGVILGNVCVVSYLYTSFEYD